MKKILLLLFCQILLSSCEKSEPKNEINQKTNDTNLKMQLPKCLSENYVDPRDNTNYKLITIGKQTWIAEMIKFKTSKEEKFRGFIYDQSAAIVACPEAFKIPSENDWKNLNDYVCDSIIKKSTSEQMYNLIQTTQKNCQHCEKLDRRGELPYDFDLEATMISLKNKLKNDTYSKNESMLIFFVLEKLGFCTYGSGFKNKSGLGHDDFSYFWSSTIDKSGNYQFFSIYTGDYCQGCGYESPMSNNSNNGYNLKCLKIT